MINQSDVIKTFIDLLLAVSGAAWNVTAGEGALAETNRVYPAGIDVTTKPTPFIVVGCEESVTNRVVIPDTRRLTAFQMFITCVSTYDRSDEDAFWNKEVLAGDVVQELIRAKIALKDYSSSPVAIDSRDFRDYEITNLIYEGVADTQARSSQEINGFIDAWQDKT